MRRLIKRNQKGDSIPQKKPEEQLQKKLEKRNTKIEINKESVERRLNRKPIYPNVPNLPPSKKMLRGDDGIKINK